MGGQSGNGLLYLGSGGSLKLTLLRVRSVCLPVPEKSLQATGLPCRLMLLSMRSCIVLVNLFVFWWIPLFLLLLPLLFTISLCLLVNSSFSAFLPFLYSHNLLSSGEFTISCLLVNSSYHSSPLPPSLSVPFLYTFSPSSPPPPHQRIFFPPSLHSSPLPLSHILVSSPSSLYPSPLPTVSLSPPPSSLQEVVEPKPAPPPLLSADLHAQLQQQKAVNQLLLSQNTITPDLSTEAVLVERTLLGIQEKVRGRAGRMYGARGVEYGGHKSQGKSC